MNVVDACCPARVVDALREAGHTVTYVATDMAGLKDVDILAYSVSEQQIVVTEDRDFCELVFRDKRPAVGIVLVRIPIENREEKPERVRHLFEHYSETLPGAMVTLTRTNIRVRPLSQSAEDNSDLGLPG